MSERPPWLPEDLFPFTSRFVDVDGHRIHYVDEGDGPTLLLLHGNPTYCFLYRHLIGRLKDRFRCVAVDHPGFGLSAPAPGYDLQPRSHARVLKGFVDALDLQEFAVMVQDWGGPTGLWMAGQLPERVRALIIGNTWAWPITGDPHFERFSGIVGGAVGHFLIKHFNFFVNVMIPLGTPLRKLDRRAMDAYRGPMRGKDERMASWIFPRAIAGDPEFLGDVQAGLPRLADKPTLIVWGDKDIAFRAQERERFERLFPRHRTVPLPGAGHYIQEDAPDLIAESIRAWWDEVVGESAS
jgi:haloalkane dehalogenase